MTFAPKNCEKSAVKHSLQKYVLLNLVNFAMIWSKNFLSFDKIATHYLWLASGLSSSSVSVTL